MNGFSRNPISSLVLQSFSDLHTPLEPAFDGEKKYAFRFFLSPSYPLFFRIMVQLIQTLPVNRDFLYQKKFLIQYKHHIRNQREKLDRMIVVSDILVEFYFLMKIFGHFQSKIRKKLKAVETCWYVQNSAQFFTLIPNMMFILD